MGQSSGIAFNEFTEKKEDTLAAAYKLKGIKGLTDALTKDLCVRRNTNIDIAVTGNSGAGKSTFINAIRGLNADSEGAAPTGTTETTTGITPYEHPFNPKLLLVYLPGVGTKRFPKETYIQTIGFEKFDFFIIVSKNRFTENDIWLAKEIEKRNKKVFFVRTNFGSDVKNENRKKKKRTDENELKRTLRLSLEENLKEMKCKDNIFIIDNFQRKKYDFPELEQRLKYSTIKKEAMVLTQQAMTEEEINEKKKILEGRIWQTALRAAFAPRANDAAIVILKKEKEFYLAQFNLEEYSLLRHDAAMAITKEDEKLEQCYEDELVKLFPFLPIDNHIKKTYRLGKQFLQYSLNSAVERALEVNSMEVNRKQFQPDSLNSVVERAMEINHMEVNRKHFQQDSLNSVVERAMEVNPTEVNRKLASDIAEKCTDLDWYLLHVLVGKR